MIDIDSVISATKNTAAYENATRYAGKPQLEVEAPKLQFFEFRGQPSVDWHSGIPNNLCVFSYSFDENHCAAYVYLCEHGDELRCTLRVSNCDGAHYADLMPLSRSLSDSEIANSLVETLVTATEGLKARGGVEQFVQPERGLLASKLHWYNDGGL
ncbi:MAG TPA: hypothetical protein VJR02_08630 [Pyrinomonadaceae bacterium]|nr:hypothetical protein [Pyrinomonadaceae bacterium]